MQSKGRLGVVLAGPVGVVVGRQSRHPDFAPIALPHRKPRVLVVPLPHECVRPHLLRLVDPRELYVHAGQACPAVLGALGHNELLVLVPHCLSVELVGVLQVDQAVGELGLLLVLLGAVVLLLEHVLGDALLHARGEFLAVGCVGGVENRGFVQLQARLALALPNGNEEPTVRVPSEFHVLFVWIN